MAEEIMITPEITFSEEPGEIRFNSGEMQLEIDDDEPSSAAASSSGNNPFEIPADISITRVNKNLPKQFIKVRHDLSRPPSVPMRPPAPVRPPPLVRAGGGLPPMPRLRLGAPRHQRMSPMQQNPLASMFNMLPPPHHGHAMVGLPPGAAPPRGFGPPPFNPRSPSHMSSMGPRIMRPPPPPHPSHNGGSLTSSLRDIRPPSRLSQNKQRMTTQRMPNFNQPPQQQRGNMMIPQDPLPAMISPKGPKGPKSTTSTNNTMSNSHRIKTVPTTPPPMPIKPANSSPGLIKPVQVPPPLNRSEDMAAKVIKNGGEYSFQGLNITMTSVSKKPKTPVVDCQEQQQEVEEEEIDDAEEDLELDDDEPANVDLERHIPVFSISANGTSHSSNPQEKSSKPHPQAAPPAAPTRPANQHPASLLKVSNQHPAPIKLQSAVRSAAASPIKKAGGGIGTLKFIRTADGKNYIRKQTDKLLKNSKNRSNNVKKKKRFFRGANYRFDGTIIKKKRKDQQSTSASNLRSNNKSASSVESSRHQHVEKNKKDKDHNDEDDTSPGDVLSYLGIQRKGTTNEHNNGVQKMKNTSENMVADQAEVDDDDVEIHDEIHEPNFEVEDHQTVTGISITDSMSLLRKRKSSDALVSAAEIKKSKRLESSDQDPDYKIKNPAKLVHPLLPLAHEFEEKPLSRTRPKSEVKNLASDLTAKMLPHVCDCDKVIRVGDPVAPGEKIVCQAMETVGISRVGCKNMVSDKSTRRPSAKVPAKMYCDLHIQRLKGHNCCAVCGDFCAHGVFLMCRPFTKAEPHLFHKQCYSKLEKKLCVHCSSPDKPLTVCLKLSMARMPLSLLQTVSKMSFPKNINKKTSKADLILRKKDAVTYTLPNGKIISSEGLPEGLTDESLQKVIEAVEDKEKMKHITRNMVTPIKAGDSVKILQLLSLGYSPVQKLTEANNGTPLHLAATEGHVLISHILVQAGAELDAIDDEQNTSLMLACIKGKANIVRYLCAAGANLTMRGDDGMTCLHLAAQNGHLECVHVIMGQNNLPRKFLNLQDEGGWTPLVWACENKHEEVIGYLLEHGADPLITDAEGNIALHWAALSGSYKTCEKLLNYGCDVNANNSIGETPIHIALRQDHYECSLLFLMRRARLDLRNKNDQLPVDCISVKNPKCATIIKLSTTLNDLMKDTPKYPLERIVCNDLTRGKENNPIQIVNDLDEAQEPHDYVYVKQNVVTTHVPIDRNISTLQHCKCIDNCTTEDTCNCSDLSVKSWYDLEGRLKDGFEYKEPPMIFECNDRCGCNVSSCHNRVLQHGISVRLQVFRAFGMGWGVRPLSDIPKGSFVCEYVGEIISDSEAETREDSYLFDLDNRDGDTFCLDANSYGNIARFINHSCSPNLTPVKVFAYHQDLRFPHIALFANRDIKKGEDLGFDYGEKFWVIKHKYFTCHCGTEKCRYSKSKITNFLQEYYKRNGEPVPALSTATDMKSPPQQLAKLSSNNSNGEVVTTDVTTKSKSKSSQNLNQNGNSDENNKKSSEDTDNHSGKTRKSVKENNSSKSSNSKEKSPISQNVVIPLTKVNVKNLNDSFNASKIEKLTSPDRKKEATETSSTNSTPASTRPRRSVTLKKTETEDKK